MHTLKTLLTLTMLLLVGICFCSLPAAFADEANSEKKDKQVARLATAIEDLQLSKKERKQALKLIDTYGADRAKIASEGWDRWIAEIDLIGQLQLDFETVLPEEQLVQWVNTIFKTDKDNWQYVKDKRIQHRTYKFAEAGGVEIPYALFVPSTYDEKKKYPIMVGLHGMECAHDTIMALNPLLDLCKHLPILVQQGDQDGLVTRTRIWVAKMQEIGMQHVYDEILGGGHQTCDIEKVVSFFNIVRKYSKKKTLIIDGQNNHAGQN
jgi:hypothetical protein